MNVKCREVRNESLPYEIPAQLSEPETLEHEIPDLLFQEQIDEKVHRLYEKIRLSERKMFERGLKLGSAFLVTGRLPCLIETSDGKFLDYKTLLPGTVFVLESKAIYNDGGIYEIQARHGKDHVLIDVYQMDSKTEKIR